MLRPWHLHVLCAWLTVGLAPGRAAAESLVALRDPLYGLAPVAEQGRPVPALVRQIAYPTLGMPALVQPASTFSVLLRADCEPDLAAMRAQASLVRAPEQVVELEVLGLTPQQPVPGMWTLHLRAPAGMAADSWDLGLDDGGCVQDAQPSALRVHRAGDSFRFAVLADEQLGDPTGLLPGGVRAGDLYPGRGLRDLAERRRLQVREELELLDPLFVLYPGDLCFGMDYQAEYPAVAERLAGARLAVFAVPGNHDAYALHRASAQPGWHRQVHKAAFCVGRFSPGSPVDGVAAVGGCVLQRMAEVLRLDLDTDGLQAWQRTLGPDSYAFDVGGMRFVGLNTYGGSIARRTAVPVSLGRLRDWVELDLLAEAGLDPLLGAPLVDNFGGFMAPAELGWLGDQASHARAAGRGLVVFGHHDPSGVYLGELAVRANDPFGRDPVAMGGFEVWNYDQPWDSDPDDGIEIDSPAAHTGAQLLRGLLGGPVTVVVGHAHYDSDRSLAAGVEPGLVRVLQTTTGGAGLAHDQAYRGYRLVQVDQGRVGQADFAPGLGWGSVPIGSLWTEDLPRADGPPDRAVVSGLPVAETGRLRFELPLDPRGYRFRVDGADEPLPIAELAHGPEALVAWVPVSIPAAQPVGPVAQSEAELARRVVRWEVAEGNQPPQARIGLVGRRAPREGAALGLRAGAELRLSAAGSRDEQALLSATWSVGGQQIEGFEPRLVVERPGRYPVSLRVVDACGAVGRAEIQLRVRRPLWPWKRRRETAEGQAG